MLSQETIEDCFGRGTGTCDDQTKRVLRLEEASDETPMPLSYDPQPGTSYNYARADHSHLLPEEIEKALRDHNGNIIHEYYAPIDSPTFTGTPTAPTPEVNDNSNKIATTEYVNNKMESLDAMLYMGVVNSNDDLPSEHVSGWMFRVGTAGTYAGQKCEVGDMIICNTTGTVFDSTHWNVIQANIDGAIVGPAEATDENILVFDGTTGKVIKDSGKSFSDFYTKEETEELLDNSELVISAALNDLDSRAIQISDRVQRLESLPFALVGPIGENVSNFNGQSNGNINTLVIDTYADRLSSVGNVIKVNVCAKNLLPSSYVPIFKIGRMTGNIQNIYDEYIMCYSTKTRIIEDNGIQIYLTEFDYNQHTYVVKWEEIPANTEVHGVTSSYIRYDLTLYSIN